LSAERFSRHIVVFRFGRPLAAAGCVEFDENSMMRGVTGYLAIGGFGALAMSAAAIAGLGLEIGAQPATEGSVIVQTVDRAQKGDRLDIHPAEGRQRNPKRDFGEVPVGCEPAFSPLSLPAHENFSARCAA
jgi:hypothetical protein